MPYVVTDDLNAAIAKEFVPELSLDDKRPITLGHQLTENQKAAIPRSLKVEKPRRKFFPDILGWNVGPWIVSQRVRDKIEELEPHIHDFIPLHVKQEDDKKDYGTYYLVILTQHVDAVIFEETKFLGGIGLDAAKASRFMLDQYGPCTLRAEAVAGRHLWRGAGDMHLRYFCSDELGNFILQEKLRGWKLRKCIVKN